MCSFANGCKIIALYIIERKKTSHPSKRKEKQKKAKKAEPPSQKERASLSVKLHV